MKTTYSSDVDIAYIELEFGKYSISKELPGGVVVDMSKNGKILGFEIYKASKRLPSFIKKAKKVIKSPQEILSN